MEFQTTLDLDLETFTKFARIAALKNITIGEAISQKLAAKEPAVKEPAVSRIKDVNGELPFVSEKGTFDHKITSKDNYFTRLQAEDAKKQNPVATGPKLVQKQLLGNLIDNQADIQNQDKILSDFVENTLSTTHKPTPNEIAKNLVAKHVYAVYLLTGMLNELNVDTTYFENSYGKVLTDFEFKELIKTANERLLKLSKSELSVKTLENLDVNYNPFQPTEANILRFLLLNESELAKNMLSDVDFDLSEVNEILFKRLHEN